MARSVSTIAILGVLTGTPFFAAAQTPVEIGIDDSADLPIAGETRLEVTCRDSSDRLALSFATAARKPAELRQIEIGGKPFDEKQRKQLSEIFDDFEFVMVPHITCNKSGAWSMILDGKAYIPGRASIEPAPSLGYVVHLDGDSVLGVFKADTEAVTRCIRTEAITPVPPTP